MYYYIFEPAKNKKEINKHEDIKAILQKNQIAGEFVTLSLAENPQDLAKIGLRRGYTTIVAVGSDFLINKIGAGLIGSDYALGAVPTDPQSNFLPMIGAADYQEACQALPQRRVAKIDTGLVNDEESIITKAKVQTKSQNPELIQVNFDEHYKTEVRLPEIIISNIGVSKNKKKIKSSMQDKLLDIYIPAKSEIKKGFFSFLTNLNQEKKSKGSIFHPKQAKISCRKEILMKIDEKKLSQPPFEVKVVPQSLNIIIKRKQVKKEKDLEKEGK